MKLLQALVAVLTILLFLIKQKNVFAGVCPAKPHHIHCHPGYCGDSNLASGAPSSTCHLCLRNFTLCTEDGLSVPKYKKDPRIKVDNEDIDGYPVE